SGRAGASLVRLSTRTASACDWRREDACLARCRARMVREVADGLSRGLVLLWPSGAMLVAGAVLDLFLGDPPYAWHPIRLIGRLLTWLEERLRNAGLDGYGGGILLFLGLLPIVWVVLGVVIAAAATVSMWLAMAVHAFLVYSLLALGDLVHHVRR